VCVSPFRLDCVVVLRPARHKIAHFGDASHKPISRPGTEKKLNLTQQKHAFVNQKKCTTTHKKNTKKTTAGFSRLLRHPAWKRSVSIPVLPWGRNFYSHTHPIPTENPVGIPTGSPYPQNPKILHRPTSTHTRTLSFHHKRPIIICCSLY